MEGDELAATIAKTQLNTRYIEDDTELVETIVSEAQKEGDVIAFLGSHGFRGMIEETVTSLHRQSLS
jgi:UDP-N-acetylmuramate-alanine ligase